MEVKVANTPQRDRMYGINFVQQATLTKLVCTRCKRFLSCLPIYRHATEGPICGRCPIENTNNFMHMEYYEMAIEFQKFPCIYHENGCLENLFPHQVAEHENKCNYKILDCPTRIYNNCTWQGTIANIMEHFENNHPTCIMKDCQFQVDFLNNHSANYLMPFLGTIYLVNREANPRKKTYAVTVSYLTSNNDVDNIYCLTLKSVTEAYEFSPSQNVGTKLELQQKKVRNMLHDPVSIIATISITEIPLSTNLPLRDDVLNDDNKNPNVDYNQLVELECPVCKEYLIAPIYQCKIGHSICGTCFIDLKSCPTCKGRMRNTRNFALENIIKHILYPCKHKGCKYSTKSINIKQHEVTCLFRPFQCPLKEHEDCNVYLPVSQLFDHIKKNHYERLAKLDTFCIPASGEILKEKGDFSECYILKYFQALFRIYSSYCSDGDGFYWTVQLVGPEKEYPKYQYEFEVIDTNGTTNRIYFKKYLCEPEQNRFYLSNSVYLHGAQLKKFIKNDHLTCRIRICSN